jgi:predicted RNA-binding Zn-ribbon protein involved in translation (DUF1610 family)
MTITFLCPNGHQLSAKAERAGKPGKCPKCGTSFVVPEASGQEGASEHDAREEALAGSAASKTGGSATGASESKGGNGSAKTADAGLIVFLCPNGHKLNGPARLQGRPGQCPHCGAKFRIPSSDEMEQEEESADEEPEDEIPVGTIVQDEEGTDQGSLQGVEEISAEELELVEDTEPEGLEGTLDPLMPPVGLVAPAAPVAPAAFGGGQSLPDIVARLWSHKGENDLVEVHLEKGDVLKPDLFATALSQKTHGVFAVIEVDDTFTVTSVPWESVTRVVFRQLKDLPKGVFQ